MSGTRQINTHLWAAGVAVGVSAIAATVIRLDRSMPIEMMGLHALQTEVSQSEKIDIIYGYIVKRNCPGVMEISMYDKSEKVRLYETPLDESVGTPSDAGPEVYTGILKKIGVPKLSEVGPARLEIQVKFRCSLLHHWWPIVLRIKPINFNILPEVVAVVPIEGADPNSPASIFVQGLQHDIKELKEKVEEISPSTPPVPPAPAPTPEVTVIPIPGAPAPIIVPNSPVEDNSYKPDQAFKPKSKPKTKPKPKPKKVDYDDNDSNDNDNNNNDNDKGGESKSKPKPRPKAKADGDTPAWFNKFLDDIK
jgi:hypothetical protein